MCASVRTPQEQSMIMPVLAFLLNILCLNILCPCLPTGDKMSRDNSNFTDANFARHLCNYFVFHGAQHKLFTRIAFKKARSGSFSILYYYHTILEIYTFFKQINLYASGF